MRGTVLKPVRYQEFKPIGFSHRGWGFGGSSLEHGNVLEGNSGAARSLCQGRTEDRLWLDELCPSECSSSAEGP